MLPMRFVLTAIPVVLFFLSGRVRTALRAMVAFSLLYAVEFALAPSLSGFAGFACGAVTGIVTRLLPSLMLGAYAVSTTAVSEFVAAMERMRMPRSLVIPLSVMFRFFPTIAEEYRGIRDAMRMRGLSPFSIEYRLVPLLVSCVKIGDELTAASLTRGLGGPERRTNICRVGFDVADYFLFAVCVSFFVCFALRL
jgi:energy-coupling factor transport system permease protein